MYGESVDSLPLFSDALGSFLMIKIFQHTPRPQASCAHKHFNPPGIRFERQEMAYFSQAERWVTWKKLSRNLTLLETLMHSRFSNIIFKQDIDQCVKFGTSPPMLVVAYVFAIVCKCTSMYKWAPENSQQFWPCKGWLACLKLFFKMLTPCQLHTVQVPSQSWPQSFTLSEEQMALFYVVQSAPIVVAYGT